MNFNYSEIAVVPCRSFYKADHKQVYILAVMRQEGDVRKFLIQS